MNAKSYVLAYYPLAKCERDGEYFVLNCNGFVHYKSKSEQQVWASCAETVADMIYTRRSIAARALVQKDLKSWFFQNIKPRLIYAISGKNLIELQKVVSDLECCRNISNSVFQRI